MSTSDEYKQAYLDQCKRNDAIAKDLEYWAQKGADLTKERDKLQKFKEYVHNRLDRIGIPADPDPEKNAAHGCRIEGRLNVVEKMLGNNVA